MRCKNICNELVYAIVNNLKTNKENGRYTSEDLENSYEEINNEIVKYSFMHGKWRVCINSNYAQQVSKWTMLDNANTAAIVVPEICVVIISQNKIIGIPQNEHHQFNNNECRLYGEKHITKYALIKLAKLHLQ